MQRESMEVVYVVDYQQPSDALCKLILIRYGSEDETESLGIAASNGPTVPAPDELAVPVGWD
jgi:hypothetical protein